VAVVGVAARRGGLQTRLASDNFKNLTAGRRGSKAGQPFQTTLKAA